jgi:hypothetical protein
MAVLRLPHQPPKRGGVIVSPEQNRGCHSKPPCVCHVEPDPRRRGNPFGESTSAGLGIRWLYDRRDLAEARAELAQWLTKWAARYPKLPAWVEETIKETLTFYKLPRHHH